MPNHKQLIRKRVINAMKQVIATDKSITNRMLFAKAIGTTSAQISHWESGKSTPTVEDIAVLCNDFNISPNYIILGKGELKESKGPDSRIAAIEKRLTALENNKK